MLSLCKIESGILDFSMQDNGWRRILVFKGVLYTGFSVGSKSDFSSSFGSGSCKSYPKLCPHCKEVLLLCERWYPELFTNAGSVRWKRSESIGVSDQNPVFRRVGSRFVFSIWSDPDPVFLWSALPWGADPDTVNLKILNFVSYLKRCHQNVNVHIARKCFHCVR